jgi:hypothetical protein
LLNQFLEFSHSLGAGHQNNFVNAARLLEGIQRMSENRLVTEQREQLVEAHSLAVSRRDDDGA